MVLSILRKPILRFGCWEGFRSAEAFQGCNTGFGASLATVLRRSTL
jgi:hypothetical protein